MTSVVIDGTDCINSIFKCFFKMAIRYDFIHPATIEEVSYDLIRKTLFIKKT